MSHCCKVKLVLEEKSPFPNIAAIVASNEHSILIYRKGWDLKGSIHDLPSTNLTYLPHTFPIVGHTIFNLTSK